jgi:hypothetical protein
MRRCSPLAAGSVSVVSCFRVEQGLPCGSPCWCWRSKGSAFHPLNLLWEAAWGAVLLLWSSLVLPQLVWQIGSLLLTYLALSLLYYVFWGMQRVRLVRMAWSYLTWTRYFRRFHDPETRHKDLA